eukprot:gene2893-3595_t
MNRVDYNQLGHLYTFGKNSHGQLGLAKFIDSSEIYSDQDNYVEKPYLQKDFLNVTWVSCGVLHTGFISGGSVYTCGNGSFGKLGNGGTEDLKVPTLVFSAEPCIQVVCANEHTMLLTQSGVIYAWGSGTFGRLGDNSTNKATIPRRIYLSSVKKIAAGGASSAAITEKGELYTWGYNKYGQLGHGTEKDVSCPTLVSYFKNTTISDVSVGDRHMGCIDVNGNLFTWGVNDEFQLGDGSSFNKSTPVYIRTKSNTLFKKIVCGSIYTCAISDDYDRNGLYIWGTFTDFSSSTPKRFTDDVESLDCSSDCGKHIILVKNNGEVWGSGWSRYCQLGQYHDLLPLGPLKGFVGKPYMVACGSYHSAILYKEPFNAAVFGFVSRFPFISYQTISNSQYISNIKEGVTSDGDTILHIIAKYEGNEPLPPKFGKDSYLFDVSLFLKLNKKQLPAFFYNTKLLEWVKGLEENDINYCDPETGNTCLHEAALSQEYIQQILNIYKSYPKLINEKLRNDKGERAFDLIPKTMALQLKKQLGIYDIGIIFTDRQKKLAEKIRLFIEENCFNCLLISDSSQLKERKPIGYIFIVSSESLQSEFCKSILYDVASKGPMVSIWGEKLAISDPKLESCIYRSQLVDLSQAELWNGSISTLMEGVYNIINFTKENEGEDDFKSDTLAIQELGEEAVFISFEPIYQKKFKRLFDYLTENGIKILSRDKGVLPSWVVLVIISKKEFSPLVRDEISLAENRNKPVIPIYYSDRNLDASSRYSFANSPKIEYSKEGFPQLLQLIKLYYQYLKASSTKLK